MDHTLASPCPFIQYDLWAAAARLHWRNASGDIAYTRESFENCRSLYTVEFRRDQDH